MGKFTAVSSDAFASIALEAGVLLKNFDPETAPAPTKETIICATTGGIHPTCVPRYEDYGADIDNVPENTKELKHLIDYTCKLAFTGLNITKETLKLALGAADISGKAVTPRSELKMEDFTDLWWVGDTADGGFAAIQLKNALSTGGMDIQTTKNGKAQLEVELTGHYSLEDITEVPMKFYVAPAAQT